MKDEIFERLRATCPKGYITRSEIKKITGGFLTGSTMSQLDFHGIGIKNRQQIGTKVVYNIDDFIEWLKNNTELINFN